MRISIHEICFSAMCITLVYTMLDENRRANEWAKDDNRYQPIEPVVHVEEDDE